MSIMQTLNEIRENNREITKKIYSLQSENQTLLAALRQIDIHIRSTSEPVPYIIQTLKTILPEYQ